MRRFFTISSIVAVFVATAFSAFAFTDVDEGDFYHASVMYLADSGMVGGYADGTFGADLNVNRAEMLKIVVEGAFADADISVLDAYADDSCFSDVAGGEWYTKYICYAKEMGWVEGYSDGTFKPAQNVNFVESMKIVLEVLGVEYPALDPWYKGIVEVASGINVIPLTIDSFGQTITRGEMSDMISRKLNLDDGTLDEFLGEEIVDVVVTYDSIFEGVDSTEFIGEVVPAIVSSSILNDLSLFNYNVFAGTYTSIEEPNGSVVDLANAPGFFEIFSAGDVYITNEKGLVVGNVAYFTTKQVDDSGVVDSQVVKYDIGSDSFVVLYELSMNGTGLILVGMDTLKDELILYKGDVEVIVASPLETEDLYYLDANDVSDYLEVYGFLDDEELSI